MIFDGEFNQPVMHLTAYLLNDVFLLATAFDLGDTGLGGRCGVAAPRSPPADPAREASYIKEFFKETWHDTTDAPGLSACIPRVPAGASQASTIDCELNQAVMHLFARPLHITFCLLASAFGRGGKGKGGRVGVAAPRSPPADPARGAFYVAEFFTERVLKWHYATTPTLEPLAFAPSLSTCSPGPSRP
jgi:hypothetical protein